MAVVRNKNKNLKKRLLLVFSFSLICLIIIVFAALKSDYFVIKNVEVQNNLFVTKEEISLLSELKGKNIFLINKNKTKQFILLNPYIEKVTIKRNLPSTVIIDIVEKKIRGIVKFNNGLINIDANGKMVQIVNRFPNGKIPLIFGVKVNKFIPNQDLIKNDENKQAALIAAMTVSDYNESKYVFYSIDVNDPFNIILKTNNGHVIKIGDWTNINYKIAYAISILKSPEVKDFKGFIQIQSDGSAILKKN
jgi:cell division protein FtsQ